MKGRKSKHMIQCLGKQKRRQLKVRPAPGPPSAAAAVALPRQLRGTMAPNFAEYGEKAVLLEA